MSADQPEPERPIAVSRASVWLHDLTDMCKRQPDRMAAAVVGIGFLWRVWLAHATFFNPDEAWHYSVANQDSFFAAYQASLTLAHPPLLVLLLYCWKHLGTSDLMLRLPVVIAGTVFCWVFYKWLAKLLGRRTAWAGSILVTFLPPLIVLSAELRQYTLLLMFSVTAAYFAELGLAENSPGMMCLSSASMFLAMLSHYSAFLFAASLGGYCILRMFIRRPSTKVILAWGMGQVVGLGLALWLYVTHIAKLGEVYVRAQQPLHRFGDFFISSWYFHPGTDRLLPFLYRGTFGIFRFIFGQTAVGQAATLLFIAGIVFLFRRQAGPETLPPTRTTAFLLLVAFVLNWVAVAAGLYPYGRARECIFLAVFAIAGVSFALGKMTRDKPGRAAALAAGMVVICQVFGTPQGREIRPLAEQRHETMDRAMQLIQSQVSPADLILVDQATSFQLRHYLCRQDRVIPKRPIPVEGLDFFQCGGLRVVSTNNGALTPEMVFSVWQEMGREHELTPEAYMWVFQSGWYSGLAESARERVPQFSRIELHSFGRYIEVIRLPVLAASS